MPPLGFDGRMSAIGDIAAYIPAHHVRPLRVFLCYAAEDREDVASLYKRLRAEGFAPWMDIEDLLPGMDFNLDYSLFRGSTITDTAEFDPFLTHLSTSVHFSNRENPFTVVRRLFAGPAGRVVLSYMKRLANLCG